ncbi:sigma-70 family RNA polymerase sigma factor [Ancylobacter amanitiformis]|uniref:RNA polymerase sigma-70 factor (ECF subfamily) n=1 Tax=Ancylobacter amanitiformis TaxID=217069 RepID=A0ABU0LRI5_9HYPH|nr:sigma-70 family RNA polymerase sigma factor [Ancylobacter amanitiformis]MDQ0511278.1 RNA polymerase sigma-70 factor (ECF subfamily) [Ancylobacter amanitiformis]
MKRESSTFDVPAELPVLRRYARALTRGDDGDAEDLVHDALVRAYERRGTFQDERTVPGRAGGGASGNRLRGWLLSILHNVFVDRRRSRHAEQRREAQAVELAEAVMPPAQEHHLRLSQVREAFMGLPEEQRAALHLVSIEGLGYAEAAAALGIPQGTLMSRLARARAALRALDEGTAEARAARLAAPSASHLRIVGGPDDPTR